MPGPTRLGGENGLTALRASPATITARVSATGSSTLFMRAVMENRRRCRRDSFGISRAACQAARTRPPTGSLVIDTAPMTRVGGYREQGVVLSSFMAAGHAEAAMTFVPSLPTEALPPGIEVPPAPPIPLQQPSNLEPLPSPLSHAAPPNDEGINVFKEAMRRRGKRKEPLSTIVKIDATSDEIAPADEAVAAPSVVPEGDYAVPKE